MKKSLLLSALLCFATMAIAQTDVTSSIFNAGFDGRSFAGWRNKGFQTQTNSSFSGKVYKAYAEKWVAAGTSLPNSYLMQTITGLTNGKYQLKVAAQNINQNATSTAQTGAYIVANEHQTTVTSADTYTVDFYVVNGTAEIGFKLESCSGNWVACDNFQLYRIDTNVSSLRTGLSALVTYANSIKTQSMQSSELSALNSAISTASSLTSNGSATNVTSAYTALKTAIHNAENSIFYTKTQNGTGTAPTVTTDSRYAVGRTVAFARSTVSGSNILEQGFCFSSTNTTPTVADERTTRYLDHVGYIHVLDNLTPGTTYYIRAYAVTNNYKVGYGDVLRIYTLPSGSFTYKFNASGDENIDARIKGAMDGVISYWNACSSITGFTPTANYASGTPTADCSYGGWIRFGPSEDYQATGTAMHECLHGIGVGTHSSWNSHMSASTYGTWYGKRARDIVRFWDNNTTEYVTGGGSHVWATGGTNMSSFSINGASEDAHTDLQYYGCGLLAQAMCEDGMVPASGGFLPGYCFKHNDNTKYYIRNTNENYGLNSSTYLYATGTTLKWKTYASDAAAVADNAAAWYIEFDPATQYYFFKNVSTGRYMYSSGSTFSVSGTSQTTNTQIHLHLGWWDASFGSGTAQVNKDTYYFMHPASTATPVCLTATSSNNCSTANYSPAEGQTAARWMIIKADEMSEIETAAIETQRNNVLDIIQKVRNMAATTHTDNTGTANSTLETTLSNIETAVPTATTGQLEQYYNDVIAACKTFMQNTTPGASGYNITFLILDPGFDTGDGWNGSPVLSYSAAEKYQVAFDIYQTLYNMPTGKYRMKMQAYERPGTSADVYTDYMNGGTDDKPVTTQVYINNSAEYVYDISEYAQTAKLGVGDESEVTYDEATAYIPNNMQAGANYFSKNYYDNTVEIEEFSGGTLQFGIRNTSYVTSDWSLFDNVRLYYFGGQTDGQDPAATADGFDITDAMAPYLSASGVNGWTNNGFSLNTNAGQEDSNGDAYTKWPFIEKWANNTKLADSSIEQTIQELPNGTYYIGGSFIASWQADASVSVTGVTFYAGDQSIDVATANHVPERYSLKVEVTDGTLKYGVKIQNTTANWVAFDNFFLIYDGTEEEYYSNASPSNPVRVVLNNPHMDDGAENNFPGWTLLTEGNGVWNKNTTELANFQGTFMESWTSVNNGSLGNKSAMQTVTLREGNYKLQAAVNATLQNNTSLQVSGVTLNFGEDAVACHTGNGVPEVYSITKKVTAGDYEIGLDVTSTDANWIAWDNLILYYYGNGTDPYHTALALCQEAATTNEPSISGAAQSALDDFEWTDAEYATKSNEEISKAIDVLNNAVAISNAGQNATSVVNNADLTTTALSNAAPAGWTMLANDVSGNGDVWVRTQDNAQVYNIWYPTINSIDMTQTVNNIPNGVYRLSIDMGTEGFDVAAKLFNYAIGNRIGASEQVTTLNTGSARAFDTYTSTVEVENNQITIGVRSIGHYFQMKNIKLEFVTNQNIAAKETDASYLRQDYFWNGREALQFDATSNVYQYAENVKIYPEQPNQLIKAISNTQFYNKNNKVVNGVCESLVITDGSPIEITENGVGEFFATNANYSRTMPAYNDGADYREWGTLILPYALQADESVQYYVLADVVEAQTNWMTFTETNATIPANTPVVFARKADNTINAIGSGNVALTTSQQGSAAINVDGWSLIGVYEQTEIAEDQIDGTVYYVAQDKFWKANESTGLTIAPFRAYFKGPQMNNVKTFNIRIVDGETTSVIDLENGSIVSGDVYTLGGQLVSKNVQSIQDLPKGVYIVGGKKIILK